MVTPEEIRVYNAALDLDGTMGQLIDWCYRYSETYTDEALEEVARLAKAYNMPDAKQMVPILVLQDRNRTKKQDNTLPYERMKLDKLVNGKVSFSETMPYGDVEIFEDREKVLISVAGHDSEGPFIAANAVDLEAFMEGEAGFLEQLLTEALYYGKLREAFGKYSDSSAARAEENRNNECPAPLPNGGLTVQALIDDLSDYNGSLPVVVYDGESGIGHPLKLEDCGLDRVDDPLHFGSEVVYGINKKGE